MKIVLQNSGGLDSLVTAKILHSQGYEIHSLFFDFGQENLERASASAKRIADQYCTLGHEVLSIKSDKRDNFNTNNMFKNPETAERMKTRLPFTVTATAIWSAVVAVNEDIEYIASGTRGSRRTNVTPEEHRNNLRKVLSGSNIGEGVVIVNPLSSFKEVKDVMEKGLELGLTLEDMNQTVSCNMETPCGTCSKCLERTSLGIELN